MRSLPLPPLSRRVWTKPNQQNPACRTTTTDSRNSLLLLQSRSHRRRYSHVLPDMQEGAAQRIEKLLFREAQRDYSFNLDQRLTIRVHRFLVRREFVAHAKNSIVRVLVELLPD